MNWQSVIFLMVAMLSGQGARASTVLVQTNRADQNSLLSFELAPDGNFNFIAETPTGGKGFVDSTFQIGPFDSDQQIILDPRTNLLFTVNGGSNSISVFRVGAHGHLVSIAGSPFASHGSNPVSLGLKNDILTVVNKHGDPAQALDNSLPNYTNFQVTKEGVLRWLSPSTVEVARGSSPSQALESPLGPLLFGADFLGGLIKSFVVSRTGHLTPSSSLGLKKNLFSKAPPLPLGLAAHPKLPILYVGLPTVNKVAVYRYDLLGHLKFQRAIEDSGTSICWLALNRAGTKLYAANTDDPSISVFDLSADALRPREIQKLILASVGGAYQLALDEDGKKLIVLTQRLKSQTPRGQGNEIHVLEIDAQTGLLSLSKNPPILLSLPGDTRPQGVLVLGRKCD